MYTLPQGCSAKRWIIAKERKYVKSFLRASAYLSVLCVFNLPFTQRTLRYAENRREMLVKLFNYLTGTDKGAAQLLEVVGGAFG